MSACGDQVDAGQVDADGQLPLLRRQRGHTPLAQGEAGVVDQRVDPCEAVPDAPGHRGDVVGVADVGVLEAGPAAEGVDRGDRLFATSRVAVDDDDVIPVGGEALRGGAAEARRCAGHHAHPRRCRAHAGLVLPSHVTVPWTDDPTGDATNATVSAT